MGLFDRFKSNNVEDYGKAFKEYYGNDKIKKAEKLLGPWEKQHPKDRNLYYAKAFIIFIKTVESKSLSADETRNAYYSTQQLGSKAMALDVSPMSDKETNEWFQSTYMGNGVAFMMLMKQ